MGRRAAGAASARASVEGAKAPVDGLSAPMRDLLWTVAQHKYGWAHCSNVSRTVRRFQTAEALDRRGLVTVNRSKPHMPTCAATEAGRAEIERRWPGSPFVLRTYEHQPGGWTPLDAEPKPTGTQRASARAINQKPLSGGGGAGR
jgi:hypothetical protein